jgi:hypothetical protein
MTEPANTVVAQDDDGKLAVFVNGAKMVGLATSQITPEGNLIIGLMATAYRLASREEDKVVAQPPMLEVKDNVIQFPFIAAKRAEWAAQGIDPNGPPRPSSPPDHRPVG